MIGKSLSQADIAELHTLLLAAYYNADTLARHAQDEEAARGYRDLQNQIRKWLKRLEPAKRWGSDIYQKTFRLSQIKFRCIVAV